MHLTELVVQGVRRFAQSRKFPLKIGMNVFYGPTESGKSTIAACLLDLMYPDRFRDDEPPMVSWGEVSASRAGLTLASGRDIYRVLRDFKTGAISLTQYSPASQKYEPLASDPVQIGSIFAQTLEMPPYDLFQHLFHASAVKMPGALPLVEPEDQPEPAGAMASVSGTMIPGGQSMAGMTGAGTVVTGQAPGMVGGMALPGMAAPAMTGGMALPGMGVPGMTGGMALPGMAAPVIPMMPPGMMPGPAMPMMSGFGTAGFAGVSMVPDDGMTPEQREARLKQLREEVEIAEKIDKIQYEIDGLQQKLFDTQSKKKNAGQFDEFLTNAKEQLEKYPALRRLPDKIEERCARYKDIHEIQGAEVDKVDEVLRGLDDQLAGINAAPALLKDRIAQAGAGIFAFSIVSLFLPPPIKTAFLLIIPAIGLMGWRVWLAIDRQGKRGALEKEVAELEDKKESIIKKYQVEAALMDKLMKDIDAENPEELLSKITKFKELDAKYRSVLDRKTKLLKELKLDVVEKQEQDLKGQIAKLEEELRKHPALSTEMNVMKKEIAQLEDVIRKTNPNSKLVTAAATAVPEGFGVPSVGGTAAAAVPAMNGSSTRITTNPRLSVPGETSSLRARRKNLGPRTAAQAYETLLQRSATLFGIERGKLIKHVQPRLNLYIQAFFGKRYMEVRIDPDGSIALKAADGAWTDFDKISPVAKDTAYLALQVTLLELATQKKNLPVIFDNPMAGLDDVAAKTAYTALKRLSEKTQVVVLTAHQTAAQLADQALSLG